MSANGSFEELCYTWNATGDIKVSRCRNCEDQMCEVKKTHSVFYTK